MKIRKIKNWLVISALGFLLIPSFALATGEIGVSHSGSNFFNEDNIYPGWENSKIVTVKNKSDESTNFFIKFNLQGNEKLFKVLKIYVIRKSDNSYRIGGAGDRYTLKEADGERLYVDKLKGKESEEYKIKIKFDKDAGNEYQDKEGKLDIKFTIESENSGAGTAAQILASEGRTVTGAAPEVLGAETAVPAEETAGEVAGAENCKPMPWYVFALILLAYAGLVNFHLWYRLKEQMNPRWVLEAVLTVAALAGWFYLDSCRTNRWFIYAVIIAGFVSYLVYLQSLRKSLRIKNQ